MRGSSGERTKKVEMAEITVAANAHMQGGLQPTENKILGHDTNLFAPSVRDTSLVKRTYKKVWPNLGAGHHPWTFDFPPSSTDYLDLIGTRLSMSFQDRKAGRQEHDCNR